MPKRHCEICGGNIKGTRKLKYCKACKEIANQVAIAKHHAEIASKK